MLFGQVFDLLYIALKNIIVRQKFNFDIPMN